MKHLRAILRHILVLLLVVSLVPGLGELAESAEHLLHDGHLPHAGDHAGAAATESHDPGDDIEHGCTPMQHLCGCHVSMPGLPSSGALAVLAAAVEDPAPPDLRVEALRSRHWPPPTPPPNA